MSQIFDYQLRLIPESKHCFSNIEFIRCYTNISWTNRMELTINNSGVTRLIETWEFFSITLDDISSQN
ncbi:hypothetical protein RhiirA1_475926 [Rhizophagus irregularis]|uniref:Uncharacterized protein n=1 Tax=Rhizophagus irregularis TaxID=588596 RepID=A0A2I1FJC9_9GLOM|nr:hypothetical protein RhiirA1_475926 [Rhizophagus irregularis]PKY34448.1 hypothetical protein RhiirB3_454161 [Rhizophagus irregularis]